MGPRLVGLNARHVEFAPAARRFPLQIGSASLHRLSIFANFLHRSGLSTLR